MKTPGPAWQASPNRREGGNSGLDAFLIAMVKFPYKKKLKNSFQNFSEIFYQTYCIFRK